MTRPTPRAPGERRLDRPPSDRFRIPEAAEPAGSNPAESRRRGFVLAVVIGLAGAAATTILGGALTVTAGLLVVAAATGWALGIGLRVGAGVWLAARDRVRLALVLSLAAVALGQAGLWAYARSEGGVLAPLDYLWEVFGALVPAQFIAAAVLAWVTAR